MLAEAETGFFQEINVTLKGQNTYITNIKGKELFKNPEMMV